MDKNTELLNALKNPRRRVILREVRRHAAGISPSEVAVKVEEPISNAGYHCRVLRDAGAIELVEQQQVRGAIKNVYRFSLTDSWALEMLKQDARSVSRGAPDLDP